jgi:hypothetical protein
MKNYVTIHQYVKGAGSKKNMNVGVLVGFSMNDTVYISGSKANLSAGDKFDKKFGIKLAVDRLIKLDEGRKIKIALSMESDLNRFAVRCKKYFKTEKIVFPEFSVR